MFQNVHFVQQNNFVSDLLLSAALGFFYFQMGKFPIQTIFTSAFRSFFGWLAVSAFVGGFGHLLSFHVGVWLKVVSWFFVVGALFYLEMGLISAAHWSRQWAVFSKIKAVLTLAALVFTQDFMWIKVNSTVGIVGLVVPILFFFYRKTRESPLILIIVGLLLNGVSGAIHATHIDFSKWFDSTDLSHFVSTICFTFVFIALRKIAHSFAFNMAKT